MNYGNINGSSQEQQDFEYLDVLTIFSVVLQLSDHEKTLAQDIEIKKIQKCLEEINNKLDYIIRRLDYGTSERFDS